MESGEREREREREKERENSCRCCIHITCEVEAEIEKTDQATWWTGKCVYMCVSFVTNSECLNECLWKFHQWMLHGWTWIVDGIALCVSPPSPPSLPEESVMHLTLTLVPLSLSLSLSLSHCFALHFMIHILCHRKQRSVSNRTQIVPEKREEQLRWWEDWESENVMMWLPLSQWQKGCRWWWYRSPLLLPIAIVSVSFLNVRVWQKGRQIVTLLPCCCSS